MNSIPRDNQFIRETNISRNKGKQVFDYLEREKNHIIYFDTSGSIICINDNGVLYETSMNTVYDMIKDIEYTRKEIEYSNKIKLFLNLEYLNDINLILRKIKCIFHRILRLKLRKKNFRISKKKQRQFELLYQLKYMELIKK